MALQELELTQEQRFRESGGHLRRALRRLLHKKIAIVAIVTLLLIYTGGIFANWISPYGYAQQNILESRQSPSLNHWAGTDFAGRDVFTRVLWGVQNTVIITIVAMLTGGLLIGITLGLVSGYFG
ncbi:MAG: hypothetical protein L0177_00440, partial [Chloroflexi bacterium]|nr:hypothetical protein [Chloroflexota bacterium]